jgi:hypothetical protein
MTFKRLAGKLSEPALTEAEEADDDEKRRRENIAAGRHPDFITLEERAKKERRARQRRAKGDSKTPRHLIFPDPRRTKREQDGFFPPDSSQVPSDAPNISYDGTAVTQE